MSESCSKSGDWFESALFGVVATKIGWAPPLRFLLRRARILRLLEKLPPGHLIEVGCGAGALLHELASRNRRAIGLETSPRALAMAREIARLAGGKQCIIDVAGPDLGGAMDLVCSFDVLEHIEDDDAAIDSWLRWLKADGKLCLSVPAHRSRWGAGDEWAGHWRRYDRTDLEELLRRHGLVVEHFECYGFPLANLTEWLGNKTYRKLLRERGEGTSKDQASGESGVERSNYVSLFERINTPVGRLLLRIAVALQAVASRTDWGSGYLVLARRA